MQHSDDLTKLAPALATFQANIPHIGKDKTVTVKTRGGGSYSFDYAPLDQIVSQLRPLLAAQKLAVLQYPSENGLVTMLLHESGQYIRDTMPLTLKGSMQEQGSLITYARRYAYCAMLGIVTDEDDDANTAMGNTYEYEPRPRPSNGQGQKGSGKNGFNHKGRSNKKAAKQGAPDQQARTALANRTRRIGLDNKEHNRIFFECVLGSQFDAKTLTKAQCNKLEESLHFVEQMYEGNHEHVRWLLGQVADEPEPFTDHEAIRTFSNERIALSIQNNEA